MNNTKNKFRSVDQIKETLSQIKKIDKSKQVGLITGCFDIIHIGHINLIEFAKSHCDILIIGLENDENVHRLKGKGRPVHSLNQRMKVLSELSSVDYVFCVNNRVNFETEEANGFYQKLYQKIGPDYVFTTPYSDIYWKNKKRIAHKIGAQFEPFIIRTKFSSTKIIRKLQEELV